MDYTLPILYVHSTKTTPINHAHTPVSQPQGAYVTESVVECIQTTVRL